MNTHVSHLVSTPSTHKLSASVPLARATQTAIKLLQHIEGGSLRLQLPDGQTMMLGQGPASGVELVQGLAVTGHFLERGLAPVLNGRALPEARNRLIALLARGA